MSNTLIDRRRMMGGEHVEIYTYLEIGAEEDLFLNEGTLFSDQDTIETEVKIISSNFYKYVRFYGENINIAAHGLVSVSSTVVWQYVINGYNRYANLVVKNTINVGDVVRTKTNRPYLPYGDNGNSAIYINDKLATYINCNDAKVSFYFNNIRFFAGKVEWKNIKLGSLYNLVPAKKGDKSGLLNLVSNKFYPLLYATVKN